MDSNRGILIWTSHGEVESDTMFNNFVVGESSRSTEHNYFQGSRMSDMINDVFGMHSDFEQGENVEEALNEEANIFYEQLRDCSSPLFRVNTLNCHCVDVELEMNLEHLDHILEEVNRKELDMPTNMEEDEEETFEEDEWIDEEETSKDDACEWIDDEETSEEDE
ncbi:hypothetical protein H5410_003254 [Solanum commersonii]|uniref:Uncharacterized protein n=1 Tax=Solanum commersonii TaxID=4109 RepID=A0A9J6B4B0_SOLCO|nr:hypothetical protein H5410_003254 [Solanum commersonii]